jgi:hypothetical protein
MVLLSHAVQFTSASGAGGCVYAGLRFDFHAGFVQSSYSRHNGAKGGDQMVKRTVLRSSAGKKLYAVRNAAGEFVDIQSYARAHAQDIRRVSKAELAAKEKAEAKAEAEGTVKPKAKKKAKKKVAKNKKKAARKAPAKKK